MIPIASPVVIAEDIPHPQYPQRLLASKGQIATIVGHHGERYEITTTGSISDSFYADPLQILEKNPWSYVAGEVIEKGTLAAIGTDGKLYAAGSKRNRSEGDA